MKALNDFGIDVRGLSGQVHVDCPQCPKVKPYKHGSSLNSKDLSVNIDEGIWYCHRCGFNGSIAHENKKKEFRTLVGISSQPLKGEAFDWLTRRGISKATIERNRITQDGDRICFNFFAGGELVNVKYRTLDKKFFQVKDADKIFYKLDDLTYSKFAIVTEGEIDALSFEEAGFRCAVSVPDGAPNANAQNIATKFLFYENCEAYFSGMEKIYLATDNDANGIRLRDELAKRFGAHRCMVVNFPKGCKDANETLLEYGPEGLERAIELADFYPLDGLYRADTAQKGMDLIYQKGFPSGVKAGFTAFDSKLRYFKPSVIGVVGIPSHGKTVWNDNILVSLAINHGWKFGMFDAEDSIMEIHLWRLCEILIGKPLLPGYNNRMTMDEMHSALEFINRHFFFIRPKTGGFQLDNILSLGASLKERYGIDGMVIDPWNALEHDFGKSSETVYVEQALNKVTTFSRENELCMTLVVHPTKIQKQRDMATHNVPTLYDIMGSSNWYNKLEVGICVYRNFDKERSACGTEVYIQKVKHKFMGEIGMVPFNFDSSNHRFFDKESRYNSASFLKGDTVAEGGYPAEWDNIEGEDK